MINIQGGKTQYVQDFFTLPRVVYNLKFVIHLFLSFSIEIFEITVDQG